MVDYIDTHKDLFGIEMLLSVSSGCWGGFEDAEEVAGEVALESADGLALGLALGDPAVEVDPCFGVDLGADDDGLVEGPVQLAVASA